MDPNTLWAMVGAIGQWAGAVGTVAAVWVALGSTRPKVSIRANIAFFENGNVFIQVTAANSGNIPVTLSSPGIALPHKAGTIITGAMVQPFPKQLMPSESVYYFLKPDEIAKSLYEKGFRHKTRLYLTFHDTANRRYRTPWKFNVPQWLSRQVT